MPWIDFSFAGLLRILVLVAFAWGCLYLYQDRLLHYPVRLTGEQALGEAARLRLMPWPDAREPRAWLRESLASRGTIVLFHGNAGHALHRVWFADAMEKLGFKTLLAEYPGYGHRTGRHSERALVGDAKEIVALARQAFPGPLLVAGESLGAAVVAGSQAGTQQADGVLLITPWLTLRDVAAFHYPWLPVRLVLRDRYDSAATLAGFNGGQVVMLAGEDSLIPPQQARELFERLQGRKRLVELPRAEHNDWVDHASPALWSDILDFLIDKPHSVKPNDKPS